MLRRMPASEFQEWMILEQIEPFGDRRGDLHAGQICATLANIHRDEKTRPFTALDCIPKWESPRPKAQEPATQLERFLAIQKMQNARMNYD